MDGRCVCGAPLVAKRCDYCGVNSSWAKKQKTKEAERVQRIKERSRESEGEVPKPQKYEGGGCLSSILEVILVIFDVFG